MSERLVAHGCQTIEAALLAASFIQTKRSRWIFPITASKPVAFGGDPSRHFSTLNCRTANGSLESPRRREPAATRARRDRLLLQS
jgi:hypothetical protein